jgi:hypothetical protein
MPWTERQRCSFSAAPDGNGNPDRLYIEADMAEPSLLAQKQIGRMFFGLEPNLSWAEVDTLVSELNRKVRRLCINHAACGEGGV